MDDRWFFRLNTIQVWHMSHSMQIRILVYLYNELVVDPEGQTKTYSRLFFSLVVSVCVKEINDARIKK
jgi:hypothetical protein